MFARAAVRDGSALVRPDALASSLGGGERVGRKANSSSHPYIPGEFPIPWVSLALSYVIPSPHL